MGLVVETARYLGSAEAKIQDKIERSEWRVTCAHFQLKARSGNIIRCLNGQRRTTPKSSDLQRLTSDLNDNKNYWTMGKIKGGLWLRVGSWFWAMLVNLTTFSNFNR